MSRFKDLAGKLTRKYVAKAYSEEDAKKIADETAADIGRKKYGDEKYDKMIARGEKKDE